ncbi:maleylpyruvate isomerase family mycothiol-dependent enzyme [Nocardia sp. NPDC060256]|uniref:maleylpyruvate isomerase family mycothiol-dependent enzyme n=1 Tax=unclassified Nocardia TaxID=2637762 RepID=UPI00366245FB
MEFDEDRAWRVIEEQRHAIADVLAGLSADEWETPSLCAGWRVADVAAHIVLGTRPLTVWATLSALARAGGRYNAMIDTLTRDHADRPDADLVAELRACASARTLPAVTNVPNILFDTIVHGQDIAIPLHRSIAVPPSGAAAAATRVWAMGWPFWARRRLRGFRLTATDIDWTVGAGPVVSGPITALLLTLTGRPKALEQLSGDGLPGLEQLRRL